MSFLEGAFRGIVRKTTKSKGGEGWYKEGKKLSTAP